ncbi:MAG: undecaprenyldiphospho-muramoylpentapeptide beta-N-acetylglucosaminyltransferase [Pseudomonadota bacterium]|nr:undecaprenyldiphospho-muramoylpentapeptide beta-N-acetylglucosaminyltransferase [Pseudomonadota bacterium]
MARRNKKPLVILAAGGTGGHVFPAEALAAELIKRGLSLALVTDRRGENLKGGLGEIDTYRVSAGGVAGKNLSGRIISAFEILVGTFQSWLLLRRLQPSVVIGFGGYASVPTMLAAAYSGIKAVIHEQNAVLGRANKLLAGRVGKIATSFENVRKIPEALKLNTIVTGMPVRPTVISLHGEPYPALDQKGEIKIAVFGGSQGAHIFSKVVPNALRLINEPLRRRIRITQQCRLEDVDQTKSKYQDLGIKAEISSFFSDIPHRIADSHLVICRSGASTIAELTIIGRPAIFVPYMYAADDHQSQNAYAIDEVGGGWLIPEKNFTEKVLADRLESLFSVPKILKNAGAAAEFLGKPNAVNNLADIVIDLVSDKLKNKQWKTP